MVNRGRHKKKAKPSYRYSWLSRVLSDSVITKMLQHQVDQGNPPNIHIFENDFTASRYGGGFTWDKTPEGWAYWEMIRVQVAEYKYNHMV